MRIEDPIQQALDFDRALLYLFQVLSTIKEQMVIFRRENKNQKKNLLLMKEIFQEFPMIDRLKMPKNEQK